MKVPSLPRRWMIISFGTLAAVLLTFAILRGVGGFLRMKLPYRDSFAQGRMSEWQAYGGSWKLTGDGIRNSSNERGAKLIAGAVSWNNYALDADVELLGQAGDAGVIVRASDEEDGVNSFSGYYIGLRNSNNTVTIGRADHGWMEYQVATLPVGIKAFHLYHLHVVAVDCVVAAVASDSASHNSAKIALREDHCARTGRIGLRSYASGGIWRNIQARDASQKDLDEIVRGIQIADSPETLQTESGFNSALAISLRSTLVPWVLPIGSIDPGAPSPSLRSLRLVSSLTSPTVSVHGTVVLTGQAIFMQDTSGGVAITGLSNNSLNIGDEIEVTGVVAPHPFSASFDRPQMRFLWSGEPPPPLSITASQASTGQYDAMFIEVEGVLRSIAQSGGDFTVLELDGTHQRFSAILPSPGRDRILGRLQPGSHVRIRGVCVSDTAYTQHVIPFSVLLRNANDVFLVAGPPWWSARRLIELAWVLTALTFLCVVAYLRIAQWRLRAVLEERSRLARDIHDTLAQSLAGIALQLESSMKGPSGSTANDVGVEIALQMARQSRREAHVTIAALRSLSTDQPLSTVLEKMLAPQLQAMHLKFTMASSPDIPRLSAEIETHILRIAQEAVANAVQHSHATEVEIRISSTGNTLALNITDNGTGFDATSTPGVEDGHFGITGMKERAWSIGATLDIQSNCDGTTVCLVVPDIEMHLGFRAQFLGLFDPETFRNYLARIRERISRRYRSREN